ncbi:DUF3301 domain-containing protein [Candidatus Marithrix sp. Canyon 246]|uniref:DUF3301 domain-containing protein n=1 Tax=Candidatus Marithrix sp. Canyon 246 TaxID=1827136 RepID=UPI00084A1AB2|nr:DUF3301 domain-containing protein [Candidatus Marithrix sp. Canyon 246]
MITTIILLLLISLLTWFWFDTLKSRERAKNICKQSCRELKLQLLDDTIALIRIRLKRNNHGKLIVQRLYQFEFDDGNNQRQTGRILMRGISLEMLEMPGYMDRIIQPI